MIIPYWFQTPSSKDGVLIIHDQNAHAKVSGPAKSLTMLSNLLSSGRLLLDTTGVGLRDIYKANQTAMAVKSRVFPL